jgi:hypothetical protein
LNSSFLGYKSCFIQIIRPGNILMLAEGGRPFAEPLWWLFRMQALRVHRPACG